MTRAFIRPEGLSDMRTEFPVLQPIDGVVAMTIVLPLSDGRTLIANDPHGWLLQVSSVAPWWRIALDVGRASL